MSVPLRATSLTPNTLKFHLIPRRSSSRIRQTPPATLAGTPRSRSLYITHSQLHNTPSIPLHALPSRIFYRTNGVRRSFLRGVLIAGLFIYSCNLAASAVESNATVTRSVKQTRALYEIHYLLLSVHPSCFADPARLSNYFSLMFCVLNSSMESKGAFDHAWSQFTMNWERKGKSIMDCPLPVHIGNALALPDAVVNNMEPRVRAKVVIMREHKRLNEMIGKMAAKEEVDVVYRRVLHEFLVTLHRLVEVTNFEFGSESV